MHSHVHKACQIRCNNFQGTVQSHGCELPLYDRTSRTPCLDKDFTARKKLAENCAESRETVTRWPRSNRQDNRRNISRHIRATSRQQPGNGNRNAAGWPGGLLARQLALRRTRTRHVRAGNLRDDSPQISAMTFKNYEHTNHINHPTPDLEGLRKAVQEFRPNPHRVPFNGLKPVHDSIVELRKQTVSYAAIADLLIQHGVKTSRARVAEYGRIVLEGGKKRKRWKRARTAPVVNIPAKLQGAPAAASKPTPATPPATAITSDVPPPPKENSPYHSRGPHIAKVDLMSPEEAKEFEDSLKPKLPAS